MEQSVMERPKTFATATSSTTTFVSPPPKQPKIFLPLLDNGNGQVMASFMIDFFNAFRHRDVELFRASDSHANRGMNAIANAFLKTDCDVWLNIDADIRFRKRDVDAILSHDLPLVYGIYPKKEPECSPCLGTFEDVVMKREHALVEVRRAGRGFMLVKKEVLEAMKEDNGGPALRFHNYADEVMWDFFPSGPVTGAFSFYGTRKRNSTDPIKHPMDEAGYPMREWISEDWYFCEMARALGYPTLVDSSVALGHVGQKEYYFNEGQVVRMDSNIKSWKDIHGWFDYQTFYELLADHLAAVKDGQHNKKTFVEVGCWLGRSIAAMSEFLSARGVFTALHVVDTFTGESRANDEQRLYLEAHGGDIREHFEANMKALGIDVTVHAKDSVAGAADFEDRSVDAIFIDGDHAYEHVKADIQAWLPKVKKGGIISGHDFDEGGVTHAVEECFERGVRIRGRCWFVHLD